MTRATVAAGVVRGLLDFAVQRGAPRAALLERAGLRADALGGADDADRRRLPLASYHALMQAAQLLCRDPALALHFGESVGSAQLSLAGLIGQTATTMGEGLMLLNRYTRLVADGEGFGGDQRFTIVTAPEGQWFVDTRDAAQAPPSSTESGFARAVCEMRRLCALPLVRAVHFTHAEPPYRAAYDRIFQVPLTFGSERNAILLDPAWARQPLAVTPRYAFGILAAHADELLRELDAAQTTRAQVEAVLLPALHKGALRVDDAARALGCSRATLYRRLKAEGITFDRVLDALRHRMALQYLQGGRASVKQAAFLVGFSDPAAFSRAFKRWTGTAPGRSRSPARALPCQP